MRSEPEKKFLKPTNIFLAVSIFIPGFSAIIILGLQMLISLFGIECGKSWDVLWVITTFGSLLSPIILLRYISITNTLIAVIKRYLMLFNVIEYIFLQCTLGMLFSDGKTLCYVTDGQNGIQFVFTAWLAIPLLLILNNTSKQILLKRNIFRLETII